MDRRRNDRNADLPPAGPGITAFRIFLLLVFLGFGALGAARGEWFVIVLMVFGCWGVVAALRSGKGLKRLEKH